jgi:hypothetical protein
VFPQVTPTTSVNQSVPIETSPGVQSSRQSNDINDANDQVDADLEGHTIEGEPVGDFVPGNQYVFPTTIIYIQYLHLWLL